MSDLQAVTTTGATIALKEAAIEALRSSLRGTLLRAGDEGYEEARQVWNGLIDRRPALIVRCSGSADVIDAVNFAREHNLLVSVLGGGHNVAGTAVCEGGLMIDLSQMKGIFVDPTTRTAQAQGGVTWGDLDRETQVFGLAAPGGVVSTTGIAGLSLGGGLGWLRSKYGLSCDNILSVDLVTAAGQLLTVSETENSDLFWGIRGGGGNFGIVTSFKFRLHPVGPLVMFVATMYPAESTTGVLRAWRDFMANAPDELSSQAYIWTVPSVAPFPEEAQGRRVMIITGLYAGPAEEGERVVQPLREFAAPLVDLSGVMPYVGVQQMFDPFLPKREQLYYFKSLNLDRLSDELIEVIAPRAVDPPAPKVLIAIWHYGGALSRVGVADTAFRGRDARFLFSVDAIWDDQQDSEKVIGWSRDFLAALQPFSPGGLYVNFAGFGEEGEALVKAAYGANYDRLVALKNKYDPTNLFRLNQNIKPTG